MLQEASLRGKHNPRCALGYEEVLFVAAATERTQNTEIPTHYVMKPYILATI